MGEGAAEHGTAKSRRGPEVFSPLTSLTWVSLQKYMNDCEEILNNLLDEMNAAAYCFVGNLRECARSHCNTSGVVIQKNISRIGQDQTRLQEARCGIEGLLQESDPFRFIEVRWRGVGWRLRSVGTPPLTACVCVFPGVQDHRKTVKWRPGRTPDPRPQTPPPAPPEPSRV